MTQWKIGKVCPRHPELEGQRYVGGGNCPKCMLETAQIPKRKAADRERHARWRAANPEESRARCRRYAAKNRSALRQYHARYRLAHPGYHLAYIRQYWQTPTGNAALRAKWARRRAAISRRVPKWLSPADYTAIQVIYAEAKQLTHSTGISHVVDHRYPLRGKYVSGLHVPGNLQILTASTNAIKHNSFNLDG